MIRPPSLPDLAVLVCDASEYSRRYTREYLRAAGLKRIHEVSDAGNLRKILLSVQPDIVLLDLDMPNLDTERLPLSRVEKHVMPAIIALTSRPTPALIECSRQIMTGGVLVKPFTPSMLWLRLQSLAKILVSSGSHQVSLAEAQLMIDRILGTP
jgi:AmiR/NasT family two-component response regulator